MHGTVACSNLARDRVLITIDHTQYRQNRDNKAKEVKDLARNGTRPTSILSYSDSMSEGQYHGSDRGRVDIDLGRHRESLQGPFAEISLLGLVVFHSTSIQRPIGCRQVMTS